MKLITGLDNTTKGDTMDTFNNEQKNHKCVHAIVYTCNIINKAVTVGIYYFPSYMAYVTQINTNKNMETIYNATFKRKNPLIDTLSAKSYPN